MELGRVVMLGLVATAMVAACGGKVVVDAAKGNGSTAGSGGSSTTGSGGSGGSGGSVKPPPSCPPSAPAVGTACEGSMTCTFGFGTCLPSFSCIDGQWTESKPLCPATCPPVVPANGAPCSMPGLQCSYDPQQCGGTQATCSGGQWQVTNTAVGCAAMCPDLVPNVGEPCSVCCLPSQCTYPNQGPCGAATYACMNGTWASFPCDPLPIPLCGGYPGPQACSADPGCRWLVAGCSNGPQKLTQGCFAKQDCVGSASCDPGLSCQPAVFDPCWAGDCAACGASAMICLP